MNKQTMNRILVLLLAASVLTVLTGCPKTDPEGAREPGPGVSAPVEAQAETEPSPGGEEAREERLFEAMEIDIEKGTLYIRSGDSFSYSRENGGQAGYEIADGVLRIDQSGDHKTVLTLPQGEEFDSLLLTVGEGHVYVESALSLGTLELSVARGEVTVSGVSVTESSDIDVGQGSVFLTGDPGSSVTAVSRQGHLGMELSCAQSDYNYEIDLSNGNIHLGGENYHGRSFSDSIDNGAERTMALSCAMGDLSVEFDKR